MPYYQYKRPYKWQPSGKPKLKTEWVSDKGAFYIFNQTSGDLIDVSLNNVIGAKESESIVTWRNSKKGRIAHFNNSNSAGVTYGFNLGDPRSLEISDEITILSGVKVPSNPGGPNWARIISKTNGGTGDNWGVSLQDPPNARELGFRINNNSLGGSALVANQYHDLAFTYKSGDKRIYIDGNIDVTDTQTGSITTSGVVKIGSHGSADDRGLFGEIYYLYIIPRSLSQKEVRNISENPWSVFEPPSQRIFVPAVSGVTGKSNPLSGPLGGPLSGVIG